MFSYAGKAQASRSPFPISTHGQIGQHGVGVLGTFVGAAACNAFYGSGPNYARMAIEKNIYFSESRYLQLRLESFNTFNHANFANAATPGFSTGGEDASEPAVFGQIFSVSPISTNGDGRVVQLGVKFYF